MSEGKKLFLTAIVKAKTLEPAEVLAALIPHNLIYAHVEHITLSNSMIRKGFAIIDLPIPELYLGIILARGAWTGSQMELRSLNAESGLYETAQAEFSKEISISFDDLFVYEPDLADLEGQNPNIFVEKPSILTKTDDSLYSLVAIFIDILVDKKGKNILTKPNAGYIFTNQEELIGYIESETKKRGIYGFRKSSLQDKFGKANAALLKKMEHTSRLG